VSGLSSRTPAILDEDDRKSVVLDEFRLAFSWSGDRWTHSVELRNGETWLPVAGSLEAGESPDPARVISPSYQQFHWHEDESGGQAMLLGQSGPHHFSAVFTFRADHGGCLVAVEVADRCLSPVEALASTFLVDLPSGTLKDADPTSINWKLEQPLGSLDLKALGRTRLGLAEAGRRAMRVQADCLVDSSTPTQQFAYSWGWRADKS
jgi:hypothetical protein